MTVATLAMGLAGVAGFVMVVSAVGEPMTPSRVTTLGTAPETERSTPTGLDLPAQQILLPPQPVTKSPPVESRQRRRVVIPTQGSGDFVTADARTSDEGGASYRFTVEIEQDLPFRARPTATEITAVLLDARGWTGARGSTFARVQEDPDIRILVATPGTTDALCAPLATLGRVSCRNGDLVVINARRWAFGIDDYRGVLADYRRYVINHEVGHALGQSHVLCTGRGEPAPVMMQQTYGLQGCARNPWPTVA